MSDIDPREFGKLEAQVEALQKEVHALRDDVKQLLEMANNFKVGLTYSLFLEAFKLGS